MDDFVNMEGGERASDGPVPDRHLLLPLAGHKRGEAGLKFVSSFFSAKADVRLTLMNVLTSQARVWDEEKSYEALNVLDNQVAKGERKASSLLDRGRRTLLEAGFLAENIEFKVAQPLLGKARDIATEGRSGNYDALVIGRRSEMRIDELLDVSLSEEMIGLSDYMTIPFWVCRRHDSALRDVLLCVDGSEPSIRMADHVGYMLAREPSQKVKIFYLNRRGLGMQVPTDAARILREHGVEDERISVELRDGGKPPRVISGLVQEGSYAAVAVGCSGAGQGLLDRFTMGSVTRALFKGQTTTALWCCF